MSFFEWLDADVPETRAEIDGRLVREAAGRAERLCVDDRRDDGGGAHVSVPGFAR